MKIKSAVWQGARTVRKKLCQLVLFVQENAWQTGVQGKKASVAWMREFIWQGLHFICGRNPVSPEQKAPGQCSLKEKGAANINLVTGAHYVPQIIEALDMARRNGLDIPVVYNSSGYEKTETLKLLEGYVDIYLPDLKYLDPELAQKFSYAPDYVQAAKAAIGEMVRQTGKCEFGEDGYIRKGTIVRHLILPGHTGNSIKALRYLHETYGEDIYISIMNQYTPVRKFVEFKELNRKVTKREYEKVLDAAVDMGIQNGFIQEGETASESFIPDFDYEGVEKNTP